MIDWYRTGQLLIPQSLFDTILLVENLVCTANFQYLKVFDKKQIKTDLNIGN
jgi:hypothetical protein